jgi:hypothetical protein
LIDGEGLRYSNNNIDNNNNNIKNTSNNNNLKAWVGYDTSPG